MTKKLKNGFFRITPYGISVEYISKDNLLPGANNTLIGVFDASVVIDCVTGRAFRKVDISNIQDPAIGSENNWGSGATYSGYQSSPGQYVFFADDRERSSGINGTYSGRLTQVNVNAITGEMTLAGTFTTATTSQNRTFLTKTGNYWVCHTRRTKVFTPTAGITTVNWGEDYLYNDSVRYTTGAEPEVASTTTGFLYSGGGGVQVNGADIIMNFAGSSDKNPGLYRINYNGYSRIGASIGTPVLYDAGNILFASESVLTLTNSSYGQLGRYLPATNNSFLFLGRNGNYYYVLEYPTTAVQNGVVLLKLLAINNLQVKFEHTMVPDPFNENQGKTTLYNQLITTPIISQSGWLGALRSNVGLAGHLYDFRFIRFGRLA